jgi:2-polyprenyl-6-methoxyphenol hydroxylase-like FAD-dependent oxidoreductase
LGGLTLAHSLAKHRIPYAIYERDNASGQRAQGYRVSIDDGGASGLRSAVDDMTFERFEKTCAASHPVGGRIDRPSGAVLQRGVLGLLGSGGVRMIVALLYRYLTKRWERWDWKGRESILGQCHLLMFTVFNSNSSSPLRLPSAGDRHYQVDRRVLRSALLESQSDKITYDSAFRSYSITDQGVTAHFFNGTSARGSLLVGADGIRSKVAAQLAGGSAFPLDLGLRTIYGKTPLSPKLEQALHRTLRKGISFVTDRSPSGYEVTLVLETMEFPAIAATDDYIFWAPTTRKGGFDQDDERLLGKTGKEAASLSVDLTAHWDPSIRVIFEQQAVEETAILRVSSSDPDRPPNWETNRRCWEMQCTVCHLPVVKEQMLQCTMPLC